MSIRRLTIIESMFTDFNMKTVCATAKLLAWGSVGVPAYKILGPILCNADEVGNLADLKLSLRPLDYPSPF